MKRRRVRVKRDHSRHAGWSERSELGQNGRISDSTHAPPISRGAPLGLTRTGILGLGLAMFLASLDSSIVTTALPTISRDLGRPALLPWIVTAYLVTSTISMPVYGRLGDLYGRKRIYQIAIVGFLAGSSLAGISQSMTELISFRALQGLGAGGLMVTAQAILSDLLPPRDRGRYVGVSAVTWGVAVILGPVLGGLIVQTASWRWIFYVNIPLGAAALFLVSRRLAIPPRLARPLAPRFDVTGITLLSGSLGALVFSLNRWGNGAHLTSLPVLGVACLGALPLTCLVWYERRIGHGLLPVELFKGGRRFNLVIALTFVVTLSAYGTYALIPSFFQLVYRLSPTTSGLRTLPVMFGFLPATILAGRRMAKSGRYKLFPIAGSAILASSMLLLALETTNQPGVLASLYLGLFGVGWGLASGQLLIMVIQNTVPRRNLGVATSTASLFRSLGAISSIGVFGAIYSAGVTHGLQYSLTTSTLRDRHAAIGSIAQVPQQLSASLLPVYESAMHTVFFAGAVAAACAFLVALSCPEQTPP
jgi:EmrB/QacA subfamily drug resistance transporter